MMIVRRAPAAAAVAADGAFTKLRTLSGMTVLLCAVSWSSLATAQAANAPAGENSQVDEIVVTGSRISRKDYQSDSPIVTVSQEAITQTGPATMEAVLNNMPQFAAIRNGSGLGSNGGRNNANLRGLGPGRTLVLLDGRRLQPSDPAGGVDLNTVPNGMISAVEIITGGASATYGSDAIAGVVNFKLNNRFTGLQLDGQYGNSFKGDLATYDASVMAGANFAEDRGRFVASATFLTRGFTARGKRKFFIDKLPSTLLINGVIGADANNLPSQAAINSVFARYGFTAANVPRNSSLGINQDGTLFTTNATATVPITNLKWGDPPFFIADGTRVAQRVGEALPLQQAQDRYSVFSHAEFDMADWLTAYGQFSYVNFESEHRTNTNGYREPTIPITNPWIPADLRQILASRSNPNAPLIYQWGGGRVTQKRYTTDSYDVSQGMLGLKGEIPGLDWTWDVYGSYGRTVNHTESTTGVTKAGIIQLLNAPDGGRSVCPSGYNPFSVIPLDQDPGSKGCYDLVFRKTFSSVILTQKIAEASIQGSAFELPAGALKFAAGFNYRKNHYTSRPDSNTAEGLLVNTIAGQVQPLDGSDDVSEVFAELLIPVLKDLPFIKSLDIDIAGRNSNYASVGVVRTYKASANWEVIREVSFRGSYSRAIRAPDLSDLYRTSSRGLATIGQTAAGGGDPCDIASPFRRGAAASQVRGLCIAQGVPLSVIDSFQFNGNTAPNFTPGGSPLTEETADTYSVGVVLRSPFEHPLLSGLQVSADYYDIKLKDAIGSITAPITLTLCFNSNGVSNSAYAQDNVFCQQIQRDAGGTLSEIRTPRLNLAAYEAAGVDTQVDWNLPLSGFGIDDKWGSVALNAVVSYVDKYTIQTFAGDLKVNYAGSIGNGQITGSSISHPEWRAQASVTWKVSDVSASLKVSYVPKMFDSLDAAGTTRTRAGVPDKTYFDATVTWRPWEDMTLRAGVLNLTDTQPPFFAPAQEATDVAIYDILGRRFYIGATKKF